MTDRVFGVVQTNQRIPRLIHSKPTKRTLGDKLHALALATKGPRYIAAIEAVVDFLLATVNSA